MRGHYELDNRCTITRFKRMHKGIKVLSVNSVVFGKLQKEVFINCGDDPFRYILPFEGGKRSHAKIESALQIRKADEKTKNNKAGKWRTV